MFSSSDSLSENEKAEIIEEFGSEENYKAWKRHTDSIMRKCLERGVNRNGGASPIF